MTSRNASKIASAIRRSIRRGYMDRASVSGATFAEVFDHLRSIAPDCHISADLEAFSPSQGWHVQIFFG